jgi:spore coat polysaccharide biosynthesis protein SpsF
MQRVMIGIQARSTSVRFPGKHFELLAGRMILDHVIDACEHAAEYVNRLHAGLKPFVVLLTPDGDPLAERFAGKVDIFTGPEHDVLTRYHRAAEKYKPDYICRITGDCPLIPPFVISKHLIVAWKNAYDYTSNVDELCRTAEDGLDCEVMSRQMLDWLNQHATEDLMREHVTILARSEKPRWARLAFLLGHFDRSYVKRSVDTPQDLEEVRKELAAITAKEATANLVYGKGRVHRF